MVKIKVALIPPKGLENYALRSKFHLALAIPNLMERKTYGGMYARASGVGDFVILDNGLAEGKPASPEQIVAYARQIRADEVVLPDIMTDAEKTIRAVKAFLQRDVPLEHSFMAVVQGKKLEEFHWSIEQLSKLAHVSTLGIPRHALETLGVKACRLDIATWIEKNFPKRFEIHFLGTNPMWLSEVRYAAQYTPFVRSVDTSMPFSYTIAGVNLSTTNKQIIRPDRYFDIDWAHRVDGRLLRNNIFTLLEWADATRTQTEASTREL